MRSTLAPGLIPIILAPVLSIFVSVMPCTASLGGHGIGPSTMAGGAVAATPWAPNTWFLGTGGGGVYRLVSGAAEWEYLGWVLPDEGAIRDFAPVPAAPGTVFAITYSMYTGRYYVFRTQDSGLSWQIRGLGLPTEVNDLECDPVDPLRVYAGTGGGMYRTTDGGFTWHPWCLSGKQVQVIEVDRGNPDRIWAGAYHDGMYRSEDGGATWELHESGMGSEARAFYQLVAAGSGRVYSIGSRNYRSTDNGTTWSPFNCCPPDPSLMWVAPSASNPDDVMATTLTWGVIRTTDGGETWTTVLPRNQDEMVFFDFVVRDPLDPDRALVVMGDGVTVQTNDGGATWFDRSDGISAGTIVSIDVRGHRILTASELGVYVSDDDGRHWTPSNLNIEYPAFNSVALSPDGTTAFAAGQTLNEVATVWRSEDGGRTFLPVCTGTPFVRAVAVDPIDPDYVYAGTGSFMAPGTILRSTNGGTDWTTRDGVPSIWFLLVDPADPAIVLAATDSGILRSSDHGATWSSTGPGLVLNSISPDGSDPARFYAAADDGRILVSDDEGLSWSRLGSDLPSRALTVDGRDPVAGVLAGTWLDQIWRWSGTDWVRLPPQDQPPTKWIQCIRATGDGRWLVGTYGAGIWEFWSDPASAPENGIIGPARVTIFDSPSRGPFRILPGASASPIRIEIFDPAGRLVRAARASGPEPWVWDARDASGTRVPAGIYIVRTQSAKGTSSAKVCVLH